jgi:hypothetical protein
MNILIPEIGAFPAAPDTKLPFSQKLFHRFCFNFHFIMEMMYILIGSRDSSVGIVTKMVLNETKWLVESIGRSKS